MKFDILTIALVESLVLITQVIVLFVLYRVNKTFRGIGWWVLGSALMALGVIFMPMLYIESLSVLARFANPLIVLGQIFLYIGIVNFVNKKVNKWFLILLFTVFVSIYNYYIYMDNSISERTIVVNVALAAISFASALRLISRKGRFGFSSANFIGTIFLIYGCYLSARTFFTFMMPEILNYSDQEMSFVIAFLVPTITSILWTYGFIIMFNQRLNIENIVEKEKMQMVFNTSPDAAMITRLKEGLIIDVNEGFSVITGFTHEEAIGNHTLEINLWQNKAERELFLTELSEKGICENKEFVFERKDKSQFFGLLSARIITIYEVPHIINSIKDITERKLAEQKIQQLVQQLEQERNIAQVNSITDSLTGLFNRRYFDDALKTEFFRAKRYGEVLSLIILDIDYFKDFNDHYGHLAGDDCLRQIGTLLNSTIGRVSDITARYGGEEFVVILPKTDHYGAKKIAEQIRKAIEELMIPHATSDIEKYVTVSVGGVTVNTSIFVLPEQVVLLADEALYSAKRGGRNRIEISCATIEESINNEFVN